MIQQNEYASVIIHLLKGSVFHDHSCWKDLLIYQKSIREYISKIGLELIVRCQCSRVADSPCPSSSL